MSSESNASSSESVLLAETSDTERCVRLSRVILSIAINGQLPLTGWQVHTLTDGKIGLAPIGRRLQLGITDLGGQGVLIKRATLTDPHSSTDPYVARNNLELLDPVSGGLERSFLTLEGMGRNRPPLMYEVTDGEYSDLYRHGEPLKQSTVVAVDNWLNHVLGTQEGFS